MSIAAVSVSCTPATYHHVWRHGRCMALRNGARRRHWQISWMRSVGFAALFLLLFSAATHPHITAAAAVELA